MIAPGPISYADGADLLFSTAANTATGTIASPDGSGTGGGYTLETAHAILWRASNPRIEMINGIPALTCDLATRGRHTWYLCLRPSPSNPWA